MRNLKTLFIQGAAILVATLTFTINGGAAPAGLTYAIKGAKIVTVSGAVIDNGSIVMRDGVIQAVGASVTIPADAIVTDGAGLTVYPGLIDMASAAPLETGAADGQDGGFGGGRGGRGGGGGPAFATLEEADRAKRAAILRPDYQAAQNLVESSDALSQMAQAGITSVLAVPSQGIFKGQSALVNTTYPPDDPQISTVADYRRGLAVVKAPVAQHVNIGGRGGGTGYPNSLLGTIAFTRQGFLDAQWQRDATAIYEKTGARGPRPLVEPSLDALKPVFSKQMPVAFDANEGREIDRSLLMAKDFGLDPIIVGGSGAASRVADLQKAGAKVIYGVNFRGGAGAPGGGGGGGRGGGGGDSLRLMQLAADAPKVPALLAKAGVPFAFSGGGTLLPSDFVRNAARTVKEGGLTAEAALKAMTIDAARIAGAADRVGSIEQGKIANVVVTDGDLFEANTRVRHVFIDGRPIEVPAPRAGRAAADVAAAGRILAAAAVIVLASCSGPTKPGPQPPVVGPATAPVIQSIAVPSSRVETATDVAITAVVADAETPLTALAYQWTASVGTITGNGVNATWRLPSGIKSGVDVTVTLTVVDTYDAVVNNVVVKQQFTVTRVSSSFRAHDSVAEVKELARRFLVDLFGNSSVSPQACMVDFADTCATLPEGRVNEQAQIVNHRAVVVLTNAQMVGQRPQLLGPAFGTVHSAMIYTGHEPGNSSTSSICADFEVTVVYVGNRWWICESYYNPEDVTSCPSADSNGDLARAFRKTLGRGKISGSEKY